MKLPFDDKTLAEIGWFVTANGFNQEWNDLMDRLAELEAKLDRVRGIGQVHDSWGASKEFKDGWRECLEQVQSVLGDEDV